MKESLTEVTKDEDVTQAIFDAAKNSMGQDVTETDKVPVPTHRLGNAQEAQRTSHQNA